jgi:hypothetical protein
MPGTSRKNPVFNNNKQRVTCIGTKDVFRERKLTDFEGFSSVLANHESLGEFG